MISVNENRLEMTVHTGCTGINITFHVETLFSLHEPNQLSVSNGHTSKDKNRQQTDVQMLARFLSTNKEKHRLSHRCRYAASSKSTGALRENSVCQSEFKARSHAYSDFA